MWKAFLDTLPQGYTLAEEDWQRRHRLLLRLLAAHIPALVLIGWLIGQGPLAIAAAATVPAVCAALGLLLWTRRRTAAVLVTLGFVYSSTALVGLTGGAIEAHFHFFIIIGFIALYQDWAPFLFMILFTTISHGAGSVWQQNLIFSHPAGQGDPWLWSLIHGVAVLFACVGMMLFWRVTEESQQEKDALARRLADADAESGRRRFTSDLLVNLARRNQSMLYRQLDIINQLEESERDPDVLADLFTLDHLATRVRRNAESLLVLSGEQSPRTWSEPVPLRDVLRAAIAETEDLERVVFVVDERLAVAGNTVTDLTHLIAELTENAVRFSPPDSVVTIRARPDRRDPGGHVLTVEDWGVGMPPDELAAANALLAEPAEVDLSVSQRLGFHVVARLADRHHIRVSLSTTPGSGITAVLVLPAELFTAVRDTGTEPAHRHPANGRTMTGDGDPWRAPEPGGRRTATLERDEPAAAPPRLAPPRLAPPRLAPPPSSAPVQPSTGPLPVAADTRAASGADQRWLGWWDPDLEAGRGDTAAPPSPRPRPTSPPARPPAVDPPPVDPAIGLRRRVPQTHLAPELRQPLPGAEAAAPVRPAQVSDAADALSRYQASRQAARAATDDEKGWNR